MRLTHSIPTQCRNLHLTGKLRAARGTVHRGELCIASPSSTHCGRGTQHRSTGPPLDPPSDMPLRSSSHPENYTDRSCCQTTISRPGTSSDGCASANGVELAHFSHSTRHVYAGAGQRPCQIWAPLDHIFIPHQPRLFVFISSTMRFSRYGLGAS